MPPASPTRGITCQSMLNIVDDILWYIPFFVTCSFCSEYRAVYIVTLVWFASPLCLCKYLFWLALVDDSPWSVLLHAPLYLVFFILSPQNCCQIAPRLFFVSLPSSGFSQFFPSGKATTTHDNPTSPFRLSKSSKNIRSFHFQVRIIEGTWMCIPAG